MLGHDLVRGRAAIRARSELVGHNTRLYDDLTATENLRFVCDLLRPRSRRVAPALERVGLTEVATVRAGNFSQGMRQRLVLARCLVRAPRLLLLDEPYAGLDPDARVVVDDLLAEARGAGRTVLIASHEAPPRPAGAPDGGHGRRPARRREDAVIARVARAVAAKDLRIELRSRAALSAVLPFAATMLLALGFALGPDRLLLQQTAPGLLWLAALFASVELCHRSYLTESANGALEGLLLGPADKGAVYLGKAAAAFLQLLALFAVTTGIVVVLFGLPLGPAPRCCSRSPRRSARPGSARWAALLGLLAVQGRTRQAALPVIVLPLVTPVVIAATRATVSLTQGQLDGVGGWLGLLAAFDAGVPGRRLPGLRPPARRLTQPAIDIAAESGHAL